MCLNFREESHLEAIKKLGIVQSQGTTGKRDGERMDLGGVDMLDDGLDWNPGDMVDRVGWRQFAGTQSAFHKSNFCLTKRETNQSNFCFNEKKKDKSISVAEQILLRNDNVCPYLYGLLSPIVLNDDDGICIFLLASGARMQDRLTMRDIPREYRQSV